ncbi:MAG: hypothetical protein K2G91_00190, partial [Prevotella sp.]|nr:hypothetical protein [Prevotella sp.]
PERLGGSVMFIRDRRYLFQVYPYRSDALLVRAYGKYFKKKEEPHIATLSKEVPSRFELL